MQNRIGGFLVGVAAIAGCVLGVATPAVAQQDALTVAEWSEAIWKSAQAGDRNTLESYLLRKPEGFDDERLARLREGLEHYRTNRDSAAIARTEACAKALDELRGHLAASELSKALRSAVEYQTLSPTLDGALDTPEVIAVIAEAVTGIPKAEEEHDWLYAQELLFRLRTLYEDTAERNLYNKYDRQLKSLNRRVALIQEYAPERLYDLQNRLALRYGEEPLPPFDPDLIEDWRERVENVTPSMLKLSLRATAYEHIEAVADSGWRPLLQGGLEAMELLATTEALDQSFPGLSDHMAVARWTTFVNEQLQLLARTQDSALRYTHLENILAELAELNQETILLPEEVIYREFGEGGIYELSALKEDDYSDIIWPDEVRRFRQQTEGNFIGVGIIISFNERREIVVVNPLEGTPAFRNGIRPEDVIVEVDGKPTVGWSLNDAVDRITGREDTEVVLGIRREGEEGLIAKEMARERIELPSVYGWHKTGLDANGKAKWDWMIDPVNGIGYVRLSSFSEDTTNELRRAWREMEANGCRGLILDLRFNPGGLLDQARNVVNMFISKGEIVSIEGKDAGDRETMEASPNQAMIADAGVEVVILVNKGSASASEIVSGALQAHEAALVVGTRTFGKGSVQKVYNVSRNPDAQLRLTTQYYRLPPGPGETVGRIVHKRPNAKTWGVDPDVEVEMTPEQIRAALDLREAADRISNVEEGVERPNVYDLVTTGVDPQLETALLLLQARAVSTVAGTHARLH